MVKSCVICKSGFETGRSSAITCISHRLTSKQKYARWYARHRENLPKKDSKANYRAVSKWRREHRAIDNAQRRAANALRRAVKLQATPKWLTKEQLEEMKQFYINCPEGYHVDHIHPLQGDGFSGLHVPWNLQYLPAKDNIAKGNRLAIDYR